MISMCFCTENQKQLYKKKKKKNFLPGLSEQNIHLGLSFNCETKCEAVLWMF